MSKKIIIVSLLMLAIVVAFAACKDDDYEVSHTVPVGDDEVIEVYEDKDGNEFVTNVDGDKIPVTTDKDGFYDDITSLITQTTTKASDENKNDKDDKNDKEDKKTTTTTTTTTTTAKDPSNDKTTTTTTTTNKPIEIDNSGGVQDTISWDEIVNAGKN